MEKNLINFRRVSCSVEFCGHTHTLVCGGNGKERREHTGAGQIESQGLHFAVIERNLFAPDCMYNTLSQK